MNIRCHIHRLGWSKELGKTPGCLLPVITLPMNAFQTLARAVAEARAAQEAAMDEARRLEEEAHVAMRRVSETETEMEVRSPHPLFSSSDSWSKS